MWSFLGGAERVVVVLVDTVVEVVAGVNDFGGLVGAGCLEFGEQ